MGLGKHIANRFALGQLGLPTTLSKLVKVIIGSAVDTGEALQVTGAAVIDADPINAIHYATTAPSSPRVGKRWLDSNSGILYEYINDGDSLQWVECCAGPSATASMGRNAIINGNFRVNQRAKSGTVILAAGAYGHDRFKAGAGGCTYTFATVGNVTTLTISAGTLQQVIEGVSLLSGTYVLSWGGTAQGKIGAGAFSASGVTGAVVGGTDLTVEFNTGTLSQVQLEAGGTATAFEQRTYPAEIALCKRYYLRRSAVTTNNELGILGYGYIVNAQQNLIDRFDVEMRVAPTFTFSALADFYLLANGGSATVLSLSAAKSDKWGAFLITGNVAAVNATVSMHNQTTSAWLSYDAEL